MKLNNKAYILIIVTLVQNFVVLLLSNKAFINFMNENMQIYRYPYFIALFINILGFIGIISLYYIMKFLKEEKEMYNKLNHSKEIIDALQGQKHDFNNHLNVLGGMLQLGKNKKALNYIFNVSEKVEEVFSISKIKNVEIAATLYRKCAIAESKGIEVELYIESDLQALKMGPIDVCKILFNLIDNAVYELEKSEEDKKILAIEISEIKDYYCINISNSFPILSPELYDKVFQNGFSTKGSGSGHGYGLNIVKNVVEKNSGKVYVESFENLGTIFTVHLPKDKKAEKARAY